MCLQLSPPFNKQERQIFELSLFKEMWQTAYETTPPICGFFSSSISLPKDTFCLSIRNALALSLGDTSHSRLAPAVLSPLCNLRHCDLILYHRWRDIKADPKRRENIGSPQVAVGHAGHCWSWGCGMEVCVHPWCRCFARPHLLLIFCYYALLNISQHFY